MSLLTCIIIIIVIILVWKISSIYYSLNIYDRYDYFDYAATTPPYDRSVTLGYFGAYQGNLSQFYNRENRLQVERINEYIMSNVVTVPHNYNLIWTSGASESNNTILKTFSKMGRVIIGNTEHHTSMACVEDSANWPNNKPNYLLYDFRSLDRLYESITPDTKLISIMHVNNEIGYIYPIMEIYRIIETYRKNNNTEFPYLHSDMSQSFAKMENPCPEIDIISASAHKFYGPLGCGIIIHKKNIKLQTMIYGTQQNGTRGGTTNYPAILATADSFCSTVSDMPNEIKKITQFRDEISVALIQNFPAVNMFDLKSNPINNYSPIIGFYPNSSPYILSFSILTGKGRFNNIKFKDRMLGKDIIIGTGSACSMGSSTVLNNLKLPEEANQGFIRISFGRLTTKKAVNRLKKQLISEIQNWFNTE